MKQDETLEEHIAAVGYLATRWAEEERAGLSGEPIMVSEGATLAAAMLAILRGAKQLQDGMGAMRNHPLAGGMIRSLGL